MNVVVLNIGVIPIQSFLLKITPSFSLRPSTDLMRPMHVLKGNLLCYIFMLKKQTFVETSKSSLKHRARHPIPIVLPTGPLETYLLLFQDVPFRETMVDSLLFSFDAPFLYSFIL